jgi:P27 family predicted phage terminase small subunit
MPNRRSKRPQGHRKPKTVAVAKRPSTADPPAPPSGLGKLAKDLWARFWTSAVAGVIEDPDLYALKRWIESVDERERLLRAVRKATTVRGSTGQPVLNPLAKRLDQLEGQIERFERQFGMTPKARADLGIATGNAAMTAAQLNDMANEDAPDQETIDGEAEELDDEFEDAAQAGN